ncbi:MAG: DUF2336 domain-containing protein [Rhodopseudomonas sp.]|uniref:DUF2336 domain-containing protein n=1 Tax=Rhodopseudomonas sp. TaxID=1078 RepID=UPI00182A3C2E|nr:DUF2336 domain-containing protein [Rhodopseudomonas sp.]NVN88099.1 DUF2336 domain-containing protein [Rhodopseudomonas sp.]
MQTQTALLNELEQSFRNGGIARRNSIVSKIGDLFVGGADAYSEEQVELFGEVLTRLVEEIEIGARAELSRSVAGLRIGPSNLLRKLAMDEAIEVAEPLLLGRVALGDDILVECARSRGQGHLLAISRRPHLSASVTEPLTERGDDTVLRSVVGNSGAVFSDCGYQNLVNRAEGNDDLALAVGARPELPRHHFLRLLAIASNLVRTEIQAAHPEHAGAIHGVVRGVTESVANRTFLESDRYREAASDVRDLLAAGELGDLTILKFAQERATEHTVVALALLSKLEIAKVEGMFREERFEGLLVLARALGLGWPTAKSLLNLQAGIVGLSRSQVERALATFERTDRSTAEKVLAIKRRGKPN